MWERETRGGRGRRRRKSWRSKSGSQLSSCYVNEEVLNSWQRFGGLLTQPLTLRALAESLNFSCERGNDSISPWWDTDLFLFCGSRERLCMQGLSNSDVLRWQVKFYNLSCFFMWLALGAAWGPLASLLTGFLRRDRRFLPVHSQFPSFDLLTTNIYLLCAPWMRALHHFLFIRERET